MKQKPLQSFHTMYENMYYKLLEMRKRSVRVNRFKDPRRVKIYSLVNLTEEQKRQIDDFYLKNYGHKIPYKYFQHIMAFTGNFDEKYFPELIYAPEFDLYMHADPAYTRVLGDKNLLPLLASQAGIGAPKTVLSRMAGIFRDEQNHIISRAQFEDKLANLGKAFAKPSIDSYGGKNCLAICMKNGIDEKSGKTAKELINALGRDFVIQEWLNCHETLTKIYPYSVNTFRIMTYLWKDKIYHLPIVMRVGRGGSCVDNASSGGIFVAIDDDGTLHKTAFTEFNTQYTEHPDTHIRFEGYKIPHFQKLIKAAHRMQELLPHIGVCHLDFTLDPQGEPVLLEINTTEGASWLSQLSHGKGMFGENTAEILQWLAKMKKLPHRERKFYRYGYMEKQ